MGVARVVATLGNTMKPRLGAAVFAVVISVLSLSCATGNHDATSLDHSDRADPYFPLLGDDSYDVGAYDVVMSVNIDGPDRIRSTATIQATAAVELTELSLDLIAMEVGQVTVDGEPASHRRDGEKLIVSPPTPLSPGSNFTVVVPYEGEPGRGMDPDQVLEEGGGWLDLGDYSAVLAQPVGTATWIPSNDRPSDKAHFTLTVSVSPGLVAVSNGHLAQRTDEPSGSTFRWVSSEPMAPYLMTLGIGDYELLDQSPASGTAPRILNAVPSDATDLGNHVFRPFPAMVTLFSGEFGPYPFSDAGNVIVPGMAPTALETQSRSLFAQQALESSDPEELVAHELAHQWFGDAVTPSTWQDIWLSEGPAVYSQWLWTEHRGGPTVLDSARASHDPDDPDLQVPPADPGPAEMFGTSVYVRSAMFLVELRERMGEGPFARLLHEWVDEHRYGNATDRGVRGARRTRQRRPVARPDRTLALRSRTTRARLLRDRHDRCDRLQRYGDARVAAASRASSAWAITLKRPANDSTAVHRTSNVPAATVVARSPIVSAESPHRSRPSGSAPVRHIR